MGLVVTVLSRLGSSSRQTFIFEAKNIQPSICPSCQMKDWGFKVDPFPSVLSWWVKMQDELWGLDLRVTPFSLDCLFFILPVMNTLIRTAVCPFLCPSLRCGHVWGTNNKCKLPSDCQLCLPSIFFSVFFSNRWQPVWDGHLSLQYYLLWRIIG